MLTIDLQIIAVIIKMNGVIAHTKTDLIFFTSKKQINLPFDAATTKPINFYKLFLIDELIQLMVMETNRNAQLFFMK